MVKNGQYRIGENIRRYKIEKVWGNGLSMGAEENMGWKGKKMRKWGGMVLARYA